MNVRCAVIAPILAMSVAASASAADADPFAPLAICSGVWAVRAAHPWSGAPSGAVARLSSHCERFSRYFVCEQTVNREPASLIVYTAGDAAGRLYTRTIAANGLAGGRGDLTLAGSRWTYTDEPPAPLKGDWSRTLNVVSDPDHIHFEGYRSADEGRTWRLFNSGREDRRRLAG